MPTRTIRNARERDSFFELCRQYKYPYTVSVDKGGIRTAEQNRLQRMWHNEAAEQLQDERAEDKRAYCKLVLGVPILRAENEKFREQYDRLVRGLPYETKLELMKEPIDFPVTRLMSVGQKKRFLDDVWNHYTGLGVKLTDPDERVAA